MVVSGHPRTERGQTLGVDASGELGVLGFDPACLGEDLVQARCGITTAPAASA
ncbi:MAG: hypothetical protein ACRDTJ_21910 [Pseudonocardiaceae bacterium]